MYYPIFLDLENRPVLVVGGGAVAERKVASLVETGARVTVVSPEVTPELQKLANAGAVALRRRGFLPADLEDSILVITATDDAALQSEIAALAESNNIPVNTVDQPELCTFIVPAIVRRGDITVAISTSGSSPSLAAVLRARIEGIVTNDIARVAAVMRSVRAEVHQRFPQSEQRKRVFDSIIDSGITDWIATCDDATALQRVRRMIDEIQ